MKKLLMAAGLAMAFLMPVGGSVVAPATAAEAYDKPGNWRPERYHNPRYRNDDRPYRYRHRDWRPRDAWRDERRYRRSRDVYRDYPRRRPGFSIQIN